MTDQDRDWMERYIYQVIRRLPKDQREEIRLELQELIEDMWEQSGDIQSVLQELGDPEEFAKKYRGEEDYLIGPSYYDTYLWFVKVVLLCSLIPVVIISLVEAFYQGFAGAELQTVGDWVRVITKTTARGLGGVLSNVIVSGLGAFGSVTLIFIFLERNQIHLDGIPQLGRSVSGRKNDRTGSRNRTERDAGSRAATDTATGKAAKQEKAAWMPESLSPVPDRRAIISRGDTIVGIVFIVLLGVLLAFVPKLFSVMFLKEEELVMIPLLNLAQWRLILPFCLASLLIGLADEMIKLVTGVYNRTVLISNIVCSLLQLILSGLLLLVFPFWNPDFITELSGHLEYLPEGIWQAFRSWNGGRTSAVILVLLCVITAFDIGVTAYKTLHYGEKDSAFKTL